MSVLKEFDDGHIEGEHALDVHFVSSMDGGQLYAVLPIIDPETTVFIVASKSFGTIDTFANIDTVRAWVKLWFLNCIHQSCMYDSILTSGAGNLATLFLKSDNSGRWLWGFGASVDRF